VVTGRPARRALLAILAATAVFALACTLSVERHAAADQAVKARAVAVAQAAQSAVGPRLLGEEYTPLTSTLGPHEAKLLSRHPDFAAVAVELLTKADVRANDVVAVNLSGSFPALNIAVLAAVEAIGARPVITASVAASTWGANRPDFTWLDMEKAIRDAGVWAWRSSGASVGGGGDRGDGLPPGGRELARAAIRRAGVAEIAAADLSGAIGERLRIYREPSGRLPKALVNVGGSHVVFGEKGHAAPLRQGLSDGYRPSLAAVDGLAAAFIASGRPVIHFINIRRMAAEYGIDGNAAPGGSRVFFSPAPSPPVRAAILAWLIGTAWLLKRYAGRSG
jgi:poly-gamma-glutamate system protein